MQSKVSWLLAFSLLIISFEAATAQSIQNINASFQDGKVIIRYDLVGRTPNQKFDISLFSSHDNFSVPLSKVTGDVGKSVIPGAGKQIEWDAAAELENFLGDINFKIRGIPIALPLLLEWPRSGAVIRRGKKAVVRWQGGNNDQKIKLELFRGSERIQTAETGNTGTYPFDLPASLPKGNYEMKLISDLQIQSVPVEIKSRIPLVVKILPIGFLAFLIPSPPDDELPPAPGPR